MTSGRHLVWPVLNQFKPCLSPRLAAIGFQSCNHRHPLVLTNRSSINSIATNTVGSHASPKVGLPTKEPGEALKLGTKVVGQSGTQYQIDQIFQHRPDPVLSCVYLATAENSKKYVIKNIFHTEFEYQLSLQTPLASCPNLRVVMDTVPEHLLFVYSYFAEDLLDLAAKENLPHKARKRILRDALSGLAALHQQSILHGDVKPNNIFVDYDMISDGVLEVKRAQIGDLEMGSMIPPGLNVRGARLGSPLWRSPESHAAARINLPSDIFSYGLICIYTMLRKTIFRIDTVGLSEADKEKLIVKRLLSYFGDGPGLVGLLEHLDDDSAWWRDLVLAVAEEFTTEDPRKPFSMWEDVDESFRDVIGKMMSLDPARRIAAKEALEHPWFQDVRY